MGRKAPSGVKKARKCGEEMAHHSQRQRTTTRLPGRRFASNLRVVMSVIVCNTTPSLLHRHTTSASRENASREPCLESCILFIVVLYLYRGWCDFTSRLASLGGRHVPP